MSKVLRRRSRCLKVPRRSYGRSQRCTTGRISTLGSEKCVECSAPVVVWLPWSGGHNEVHGAIKAMVGPTNRAPPSWIDAANTALPTFV